MFVHRHKVQFYETDLMGIVHHSNYLRFLEEARVAWAHDRGLIDYQQPNSAAQFAVLATEVKHVKPCAFGDDLEVHVQVKSGGVRITFEYKVFIANKEMLLATTGRTEHAPLDKNLRPVKLPDNMRKIIKEEPWIETWL